MYQNRRPQDVGYIYIKFNNSEERAIFWGAFCALAVSLVLNGGLLLLIVTRGRPLSPLHILSISTLSTSCMDGILLFLNRLAAATPMMLYNEDVEESYINALLKLCLPLKVASQSAVNLLSLTMWVYINGLHPLENRRPMHLSRRQAVDFVIFSWIMPIFLMLNLVLIECGTEKCFATLLSTWLGVNLGMVCLATGMLLVRIARPRRTTIWVRWTAPDGGNCGHASTHPGKNLTHGRASSLALVAMQTVAMITTFPWAINTLLWRCEFIHIEEDQIPVDLSWQILPYVLYLLTPALLSIGFSEIRVTLPCHKTIPISAYRYELKHVVDDQYTEPPSRQSFSETTCDMD